MKKSATLWRTAPAVFISILLISVSAVLAFQVRPKTGRFDALVVEDPTNSLDVATTPVVSLASSEKARTGWDAFTAAHGPSWSIYLDRRSGAPLLVEGAGVPLASAKEAATPDALAASLRGFIAANKSLLLADDRELQFDPDASGQINPNHWQIVFNRTIAGVPVVGERYLFNVGQGNVISFGATRWSLIDVSPFPDLAPTDAIDRLAAYMGLDAADGVKIADKGTLEIIARRAGGPAAGVLRPYDGPVGAGYNSALVWRVVLRVDDQPGTWEGLVDAHTGSIVAFNDINDYAQAKGGVQPVSNDGIPPDGVEQAGYPMPFANINIPPASPQFTSSSGLFNCTPGGSSAQTTLAGQYVKVVDTCGAIGQVTTCDSDLDLGVSAGTDCTVPAGSSAGNTHSARSGFYHLNRIAEHARTWLPTRPWLFAQLTDNVNLNQTCNAYWLPSAGTVNFFKSGGGCRNTGEIAGVFLHEWGHGMDSNDGGGTDNPGEAYGDITAFMSTHVSCVGRGFTSSNCGGYGDACLNCTGIRDQDWAQHAANTPATPSGFLTTNCSSGGGPCGKEVHCEGYVAAETLWDLAVRDLPAAGLDLASAWQVADKLWYKSRLGSGGNAYNCSLPNSDGCAATSWFSKLRAADDDDANTANGTPHAAAIFAAFNRHKIACGAAGDASNQSTTSCPAIGAATLSSVVGSGAAQLNWTAVPGAASYNVLRNDAGCAAGSTIVANVEGTTYTDTGLANGFAEFYRVQAVGFSATCDGLLSNCQSVIPQPFAGVVKLENSSYSCSATINVTVIDANIGGPTASVTLSSAAEPSGETITVTQAAPGSANYLGSIGTTGNPAAADGLLSVADGNTITATYIDTDDGQGGTNLTRQTTATTDCVLPIISSVASSQVTGNSARITFVTNEAATTVVHYGLTPPPGATAGSAARVTSHIQDLTGLDECSTYVYSVESADAVGNTVSDDAAGAYYTFATSKNVQPNYPYTGPPVAIPDNLPAGATAIITVPDNKAIVDLNVTITSLTHTYDGDIAIHLIGPDNTDVMLSNRHGGSGANYTGTVFDDAASTTIASGAAPFTGSFKPDAPLSAFNGKLAAGNWKLFVVDQAAVDVGNIVSWSLNMTFPAAACGPHAAVAAHAAVSDTCSTGGAGNANGSWEGGEQVSFKVTLNNDGTTTLTNVTATVTSTTPGVVMVGPTASFPSIPTGAAADSNAPHFTAALPISLPCATDVQFNVAVTSDQGSWNGSFTHTSGILTPAGGNALTETFASGIPATWTIVDGGSGGGAAATWTTANPGARTFTAPMAAPVAIVDSDNAGSGGPTQDEQLITPAQDFSTATSVTVQFDQYFRWFSSGLAEVADVDVRSSVTADAWVNVLRQQGASSPNPDHKTINISAQAAGATNVQVRFHYYNAQFEWWWMVDNVKIDFTAVPSCSQTTCASAPTGVKPVADGSYGTPMKASRGDVSGSTIGLTWDVVTCSSTDHHVVYGDLANVATAAVSGGACNLGASGTASWSSVPAGSLWFVVVGDNDATTEGSWGTTSAGERGGASSSGMCGMSTRDNLGTCP